MLNRIFAPFNEEQIKLINEYQQSGMHPFTCCGNDNEGKECNREIEDGVLKALKDELICPCGRYTQNWVHSGMAKQINLVAGAPVFGTVKNGENEADGQKNEAIN
jgi:hypothetical protein